MSTEKMIDIGRQRDFGDLLQDSIRFVVWNAVPLLKAIVIFVGPLILLSGIFSVWYFKNMFGDLDPMELIQNPEALQDWAMSMATQSGGPSPAMGFIAGLVGLSVMVVRNIVFNSFIIRYKETQTGALDIQDMKDDVFKNFVPFIGLHLLQFVIVVLAMIAFAIVGGLIMVALEGVGVIIMILLMILMGIYVFMPLMFSYFVRLYEGPDNIAALRKGYKIMAASRWQTVGLFVVLGIISIVISGIISALGIGSLFGGGVTALIWILISTVISTLIAVVFSTAAAMIYFNVVGDGDTSESIIDEIGTDAPTDSAE